jgi:peptidoglycan hydrolase-like protein with peptidoglycan-binding domain
VRAVQCALIARGFDPGGITGVYGPTTASAVWALQRRQAMPRTGVVDERTGHALGVWNYP